MIEKSVSHENHWFVRDNPLLEPLAKYADFGEMSEALRFEPLAGLDLSRLTIMERNNLLTMDKMPLAPTSQALRICSTIYGMVQGSYQRRNPTTADARRTVESLLSLADQKDCRLRDVPSRGPSGFMITGVTGMGKTVIVANSLRILGPQVHVHGKSKAAHWQRAIQLTYLFVPMSHDGSRRGLLNGILVAIDSLLGTSHAADFSRRFRSIELLAVNTIALLHSYHLGALAIDENQLKNLVTSNQAALMQVFLLTLINCGIPIILIGNPHAFTWMSNFSQDARRLTDRQPEFLHPFGAIGPDSDDEWEFADDGIMKYYVLPRAPQDRRSCTARLKRRSGGIPGLALPLWTTAQRRALQEGKESIDADDIEAAYASRGFDEMRDLADGFALKDPVRLMRWRDTDVPVDFYAQAWGKPILGYKPEGNSPHGGDPAGNSAPSTRISSVKRQSEQSKFKSAQTRKRNKEARIKELDATLSSTDLRTKEGLQKHALAAFREMCEEDKS